MEKLKRLLWQTDDEALTGWSNKGLVKRAYKDLEKETPSFLWKGDSAEVTLKDAVCHICVPLGESTCSCPSRSVCRHLIASILCLKRDLADRGEKPEEDLKEDQKEELFSVPGAKGTSPKEEKKPKKPAGDKRYRDFETLSQAARSMQEGIRLQLMTGLSRLSPEAAESMERLAVISHSAGLAEFEIGFREAASEYRQYFSGSSGFRAELLADRLLGLYFKALKLEKERDPEQVRAMAGVFRDSYNPVPRLHLIPVGQRSFHSKTGYEGEIYYFLETEQRRWYTWTDARPLFYEGVRKISRGEQAQAPWGLMCSREQMMELEFYLDCAKATGDGRLSASQETKAEIAGKKQTEGEAFRQMAFTDYRKLLELCHEEDTDKRGKECLALVEAASCREGSFDSVQQRFSMELFDRGGRRILAAVKYSREEKLTIQALERLGNRLGTGKKPFYFFGSLYLEQGQLCLYPIEIYEREHSLEEQEEVQPAFEKVKSLNQEYPRRMEQFLKEIREVLNGLFQSGLDSAREETLLSINRLAEESEELGLHGAAGELACLKQVFEGKRHRAEFDPEPAFYAWIRLIAYLRYCENKVSMDQALIKMEEGVQENEFE